MYVNVIKDLLPLQGVKGFFLNFAGAVVYKAFSLAWQRR
jgi:hypothetical protein